MAKLKIQPKRPVEELTAGQVEFCRLMAKGVKSIDAYNLSHKSINKVRASTYLQSLVIWDEIVNQCKQLSKEKHIVEAYDNCVKWSGHTPTSIFYDYFEDKDYFDERDDAILYSLRRMCFAWPFFATIDREYFLKKLREGIINDFDVLKILMKNNPDDWKLEFSEFKKDLCSAGVVLNQILRDED